MASRALDVSDPPSRQESVVGSETGYRLDEEPERYRDFAEVSEETGLLGAGDDGDDPSRTPTREDTWLADPDFEHLPAWRRPSVRYAGTIVVVVPNPAHAIVGPHNLQAILTSRSGGCSAPTLSTHLLSVVLLYRS